MERIRIGVVGLSFGQHVVKDIYQGRGVDRFELAGVCDVDRPRADAVARQYRTKAHYSIDSLLADSTIPAIALITGPNGRADLIRRIIGTGRDVMTTKPFEVSSAEASRVLGEATSLGRVVHMNSPAPISTEDVLQLDAWRHDLNLGAPVGGRAELWASYREDADGSWYDSPDACPVAPIYRLGIYMINDLVHFFGEAESVNVLQSRLFTGRPTPDNAQLGIRFRNGAIANVYASFCVSDTQSYRNALTLNYERGTLYRNTGPAYVLPASGHSKVAVVVDGGGGKTKVYESHVGESGGAYQWEAFYNAIKRTEKQDESTTHRRIVAGLRVVEAMARSAKSGRTEPVVAL